LKGNVKSKTTKIIYKNERRYLYILTKENKWGDLKKWEREKP